ncbi:hypothetical protein [Streptomyces sp. NPDC088258]|uniref:hypothetical protein n=1 Tax=Streptomyces sp. NPDC088258 TaxID=3365849 RepID=UPI00382363FF
MSAIHIWRRVRGWDKPAAVVVAAGNVLLCCVLFVMMIGGLPGFVEVTTGEQESAARTLTAQIFGCWLAGGLMIFSLMAMFRTLFSHLVTLLIPPAALIVMLLTAFLLGGDGRT